MMITMNKQFFNNNTNTGKTGFDSYPGRLKAKEVGEILGFEEEDISRLVTAKLLKPLGKPVSNATKYFAFSEICSLRFNPDWLGKATQSLYDYWKAKNAHKVVKVKPNAVEMKTANETVSLAA